MEQQCVTSAGFEMKGIAREAGQATAEALAAKYDLASRLVDSMRFGEAIRILEGLGDYGNSRALLKEALELKAYSDVAEAEQREERRRRAEARAAEDATRQRRQRCFMLAAMAGLALFFLFMR